MSRLTFDEMIAKIREAYESLKLQPLRRGFASTYDDKQCACPMSALAIKCNAADFSDIVDDYGDNSENPAFAYGVKNYGQAAVEGFIDGYDNTYVYTGNYDKGPDSEEYDYYRHIGNLVYHELCKEYEIYDALKGICA